MQMTPHQNILKKHSIERSLVKIFRLTWTDYFRAIVGISVITELFYIFTPKKCVKRVKFTIDGLKFGHLMFKSHWCLNIAEITVIYFFCTMHCKCTQFFVYFWYSFNQSNQFITHLLIQIALWRHHIRFSVG